MNNIIKAFIVGCIKNDIKLVEKTLTEFESASVDDYDVVIIDNAVSSLTGDNSIFSIFIHAIKNPNSVLVKPILKCLQKTHHVERIYKLASTKMDVIPILKKAVDLNLLSKEYFAMFPIFFDKMDANTQIKIIHVITKYEKMRDEFGREAKKYRPTLSRKVANSVSLTGLRQHILTFKIEKGILEKEAIKILKNKEKYKYIATYSKFYDQVVNGRIISLSFCKATVEVGNEVTEIKF